MIPVGAARKLKDEQSVRLVVQDRVEVRGFVEFVSPTIDAESDSVRAKIRIPNPDLKLESGAPCMVLLEAD